MPRSLLETRQIIHTYSGGPILKTAAEDALWYAERFRQLLVELVQREKGLDRRRAEQWVDDQAG